MQENFRVKIFLFCFLLVSVQVFSQSVPRGVESGGSPSQDLRSSSSIEFRVDARVFAVTAALNAAGFDYETTGKQMSKERTTIREALQHLEPALQERLKKFYETHKASTKENLDWQSAYISLALLLSGPPNFAIGLVEEEIPEDVLEIRGFEFLVEEVYRQGRLGNFWQHYKPIYARKLKGYEAVMEKVIKDTSHYFRIAPIVDPDRKIILIPNFLNANGVVNARNLEQAYYVMIGPADEPSENYKQLQHEYLHFLLDPLVRRYRNILFRLRSFMEVAQDQPSLRPGYANDWFLVVVESLVESIQLKLDPPDNLEKEIVEYFRKGLVLVPYFYRGLGMYEENELISLPVYTDGLLQGISDAVVQEDSKTISILESRIKTAEDEQNKLQKEALRAEALGRQVKGLLAEVGALLAGGNLEAAQEKSEQLLLIDSGNANALFYLAQIASQRNQLDVAADYYRKTANAPKVSGWIRAWCILRIGNYLAFGGDIDEARVKFRAVLEMKGDLRGARKRAQESLERLPLSKVQ